jgi:hypothetical protein
MPKIIIFMEGGVLSDVVSDIPDVQVFKVEDDDGGDAAQGDEYRRLTWPGKDKYTATRWAYEFGRATVGKGLIKKLVPQILSDDTYATWCHGCNEEILLKDSLPVEGRDGKFCPKCSKKPALEKSSHPTA